LRYFRVLARFAFLAFVVRNNGKAGEGSKQVDGNGNIKKTNKSLTIMPVQQQY